MSPLAPSSLETSEELFDKVVAVNFRARFGCVPPWAGGWPTARRIDHQCVLDRRAEPETRLRALRGRQGGLTAVTQVFALEYAPTVRVNTLCACPC